MNATQIRTETTETLVSASATAVTEHVPDGDLAAYRHRQHAAGRFITRSSIAGPGGYYVTTVKDPRTN